MARIRNRIIRVTLEPRNAADAPGLFRAIEDAFAPKVLEIDLKADSQEGTQTTVGEQLEAELLKAAKSHLDSKARDAGEPRKLVDQRPQSTGQLLTRIWHWTVGLAKNGWYLAVKAVFDSAAGRP